MKVLLLGSGGREHALAWKIVQSPKLGKLYVAPGNAGTAQLAENVSLAVTDFRAIGDFIQDKPPQKCYKKRKASKQPKS